MLTLNLTGSDQARSYTHKPHVAGGTYYLKKQRLNVQGKKGYG